MWLSDKADFTSGEMNNKTFTLKVNVYANAEVVSDSEPLTLRQAILNKYEVIEEEPTLDKTSQEANENGLYKSTLTNSGKPTYYFRGNVDNTVEFAENTWKVVRINEDGTIRLILANGIKNNTTYLFNPGSSEYEYLYYSNSNIENGAKYQLDEWYQTNIIDKDYDDNIVLGDYFCEEAKVRSSSEYTAGNAIMTYHRDYTPTFKCNTDGNNKGIVNENVGLLTYDEVIYAGGHYEKENSGYYLNNGNHFWTMSPAGVYSNLYARLWLVYSTGYIGAYNVFSDSTFRPVINLKADTKVTLDETGIVIWKVVE